MANQLKGRPLFPTETGSGPHRVFLNLLIRVLTEWTELVRRRANETLARDGNEAMEGPLPLRSYTTAGLPAAASHTGAIVYVSDAAPGSKFQGSDGTAWVALG